MLPTIIGIRIALYFIGASASDRGGVVGDKAADTELIQFQLTHCFSSMVDLNGHTNTNPGNLVAIYVVD